VVFDFDGTLVDSNQLKIDAFYSLFDHAKAYHPIIAQVLDRHGEEPRGIILRHILERCEETQGIEDRVKELSERYGRCVFDSVKRSPPMRGAEDLIKTLRGRCALYISSGTPHEALGQLIEDRGWARYFQGTYGYPVRKPDALGDIMTRESVGSDRVLVVGDGRSDELAAKEVGARFFFIGPDGTLIDLYNHLERYLR